MFALLAKAGCTPDALLYAEALIGAGVRRAEDFAVFAACMLALDERVDRVGALQQLADARAKAPSVRAEAAAAAPVGSRGGSSSDLQISLRAVRQQTTSSRGGRIRP